MTPGRRLLLTAIPVLLAFLLLPSVVSVTQILLLTQALTYAVFALSLYPLLAEGGVVSFGHAAFLAGGAYFMAIATVEWGWGPMPAFILVPLVCAALSALIGWFSIRLSALYFAMLTLAFAQFIYSVLSRVSFFGGEEGIIGVDSGFLGIEPTNFYYAALVMTAITFAVVVIFRRSPFGLALRSTRENPTRAEFSGLSVKSLRFITFVICGALAGFAGALLAMTNGTVSPELSYWTESGDVLIMVLIGGLGSVWGPVVGALALTYGQKYVAEIALSYWEIALGLILIALVLFFPAGLTGGAQGFRDARKRFGTYFTRRPKDVDH